MQLSIGALVGLGWIPGHNSRESIKTAVDALLKDVFESKPQNET